MSDTQIILSEDTQVILTEEKTETALSENDIQFVNTFEITFTVKAPGSPNDTGEDLAYAIDADKHPFTVKKVKISPNKILYQCAQSWCNLTWINRVGVDDPKYTPKYCARCARAYDRGDRADQTAEWHQLRKDREQAELELAALEHMSDIEDVAEQIKEVALLIMNLTDDIEAFDISREFPLVFVLARKLN